MSGKNQHFIPRSLLRGFRAARPGEENVWVYRRDKVFNPSLGGVAAQRFFYSELAIDGAKTLDDTITDYETGLNDKIQYLRERTGTETIDPAQVAEVIAHLTIRNAHTRSVMSHGLRHIVVNATALFSDEVAMRNLIGFDNDAPDSKFSKMILDILRKEPRLAPHGISPEALLPISIALAKEGLPEIIKQKSPIMRGLLAHFYFQADTISRDSHVKALASDVVPELRVDALRGLHWRIEETTRPLILPDCVALCIDEDAQILPLLLADADKLGLVLMPVGATKLLVGERKPVPGFTLEHFSLLAAACSETFFVANANTPDFQKLRAIIGTKTTGAMDKAIKEAIDELTATAPPAADNEANNDLSLVPLPAEPHEPLPPLPLSLHFLNISSREAADKISGQVQAIVGAIYSLIPLERLDGITFAGDYTQAIAEVSGRPSVPFATEYGESVSMAVRVEREGVAKTHLVIQLGLGFALIEEGDPYQGIAIHTLVEQLAHVGCLDIVEQSFPGFDSTPPFRGFDAWHYSWIMNAWSGYFVSRVSAPFGADMGLPNLNLLLAALEKARQEIPAARLDYRFHGDLDRFMTIARQHVAPLLVFAAKLLGHYDGLDQPVGDPDGELKVALERTGLPRWFEVYQKDLRKFWNKRGHWTNPQEFLALNGHVDRLLVLFGVLALRGEADATRIVIPLASDAVRLPGAMVHRPYQTLRVLFRVIQDLLRGRRRRK